VNHTNLNSFGIEEYIGNNAAVLISADEKVCDFATRIITGFHKSVNDVVSNARFANGEVKRYHTSNLLNGGTAEANHDTLQHGAVREIYGIDQPAMARADGATNGQEVVVVEYELKSKDSRRPFVLKLTKLSPEKDQQRAERSGTLASAGTVA
jgi:hypothetical protein